MENVLTLSVILNKNNTLIISSKEKRVVTAVYNCKTAEQIANAVRRYIDDIND